MKDINIIFYFATRVLYFLFKLVLVIIVIISSTPI